jgi:hypothetical protein
MQEKRRRSISGRATEVFQGAPAPALILQLLASSAVFKDREVPLKEILSDFEGRGFGLLCLNDTTVLVCHIDIERHCRARNKIANKRYAGECLVKPEVEEGVFIIDRHKGRQYAHFVGNPIFPEIRIEKFDLIAAGRGHGHFIGLFGFLPLIDFIVHIHEELVIGNPFNRGAVYKSSISLAYCIVMYKGQVHAIQLIFNDSGVVGFPVICDGGISGPVRNIVEELGNLGNRQVGPIPDPDKSMSFIYRPGSYFEI